MVIVAFDRTCLDLGTSYKNVFLPRKSCNNMLFFQSLLYSRLTKPTLFWFLKSCHMISLLKLGLPSTLVFSYLVYLFCVTVNNIRAICFVLWSFNASHLCILIEVNIQYTTFLKYCSFCNFSLFAGDYWHNLQQLQQLVSFYLLTILCNNRYFYLGLTERDNQMSYCKPWYR